MTHAEVATGYVLDDLFEYVPLLAALRGYERDKTRDEMRRLIEYAVQTYRGEGGDDDGIA